MTAFDFVTRYVAYVQKDKLTNREIAVRMGMTPTHVSIKASQYRKQLREKTGFILPYPINRPPKVNFEAIAKAAKDIIKRYP